MRSEAVPKGLFHVLSFLLKGSLFHTNGVTNFHTRTFIMQNSHDAVHCYPPGQRRASKLQLPCAKNFASKAEKPLVRNTQDFATVIISLFFRSRSRIFSHAIPIFLSFGKCFKIELKLVCQKEIYVLTKKGGLDKYSSFQYSGKGRGIFSGLQNGFSLAESFPVSNAPLGTQMSTMVDEIRVLS